MLIILSPAKTLDLVSPLPPIEATQPRHLEKATKIAQAAAKLKAGELQTLMHISAPLAALNVARFKAFETPFTAENARPALFTFAGDVYAGLDAASLSAGALDRAQDRLRILSGLYGVLRPMDLMQPYRLEMGTRFGLGKADTLYKTWGTSLAKDLNEDLAGQDRPLIVNLASEEYWKAVDLKALRSAVLTIDFRDRKAGRLRFNSFVAKRARGAAARALLEGGAETAEPLKAAKILGHRFEAGDSTADRWMFVREVP